MADGHYACILEDDNTFFPQTLEQNIETLRTHGVPAMFRAQQHVIIGGDGEATPVEGHRGLAEWLREGMVSHRQLAALHLILPGLSDTTLFWRLPFPSRIRLVAQADSPLLDVGGIANMLECWRCLLFDEPLYFVASMGSTFAVFPERQGEVTPALDPTSKRKNRDRNRWQLTIAQTLARVHGPELFRDARSLIEQTYPAASRPQEHNFYSQRLMRHALSSMDRRVWRDFGIKPQSHWKQLAKKLALMAMHPNPSAAFSRQYRQRWLSSIPATGQQVTRSREASKS